jgi:hypothetical protein
MEQMPHLLNFIRSKGTLDVNHHAVLISHTADDELTYLTGVYGDRHGIPVANSFGVFRPDRSVASEFAFFYWTNHISDLDSSSLDTLYGMLSGDGKNAPAPWVPFTRAGCDVGVFSSANIAIETPSFNLPILREPPCIARKGVPFVPAPTTAWPMCCLRNPAVTRDSMRCTGRNT